MTYKEYPLTVCDTGDGIYMIKNKARKTARIITKTQYDWLYPLLEITKNRKEIKDNVTSAMLKVLQIVVDVAKPVAPREIVSLTHINRGTVSNVLYKLRNLGLVFWVDTALYQATEKGIEKARKDEYQAH